MSANLFRARIAQRALTQPQPRFNPASIFQTKLRTMASIATRQPTGEEKAVIDDVLCLYQLKPSDGVYARYTSDAVFHDPVSIARGLDSIKSQFNGMPKIFESSTTQKCDVIEGGAQGDIVLDLTQHYVFKGSKTPEKTVNSKITLKRNAHGLIQHHEEEWDHEPNKTGEDGFMGKLQELRKKFDAKVVEAAVSSDPNKI